MSVLSSDTKGTFSIGALDYSPAFRCHLAFIAEDDGTFSAVVLNLPGVGSCGDTEEDAEANAREAIAGALESFAESKKEIPWLASRGYEIPKGAKQKWILVNA
jgi:predicted RNase H-like HicB family nuclease